MQKNNKAAIGFIFITLMIDVTGVALIIPVMPKLIEQLIHGGVSEAARYGGWLIPTYAVMQFLFSPVLGGLSDKYGRRPILLFSLIGLGIDYVFLSFAPTIAWLFVGRAIAGIAGASFTTATAYIADISTDENRAQNFGMVGAAFGVGFVIGPVIGGLLGSFGPRIPFMVAAGLSLLNALYGYFILPESLPAGNRREFSWKRANPIGSLKQLSKHKGLGGLVAAFVLIYIASQAVQANWGFFVMEKFNWSEKMIGYSLGLVGLLVGAVQGGLIRIVNPWLGNEKSVYIGFGFYALGLLLFAFANQSWMMFVFLVPYCLGGICGPALQSIISGNVPANEQGELQGALTSLISLTSIVGPPLMTGLFAYYTGPKAPVHFSGAAFLLGAILMIASTIIAYRALHPGRKIARLDPGK
ncbi:TCR/Tet family MFS transporter [Ferruginibacter sp. HRS2-29]|uniref:TCR/Tet family MFS transporter n=1 Tax=Ferruginibacter sp. HRS2-29 TaxID=2487334 RepID=UPI0020CC179F|nr:TCR/Tet family MFS transporter [Ferruginibacter sp. HRS2-29]MCP9752959.1 MFS transporter [Ferruginibacter sp. HRS2-29]